MSQLSIEKTAKDGNVPKAVLLGAAMLVAFSLVAAAAAR